MDEIKELEIRLDGILERRTRDLCLRELFTFAKDRFEYYHDMLKGKEVLKLDEILASDDEAINEEAVNFYMVKQYAGYCEYLNECISDLNKEYEEIALIKAILNHIKVKSPDQRVSKCKIQQSYFFCENVKQLIISLLVGFGEKWTLTLCYFSRGGKSWG